MSNKLLSYDDLRARGVLLSKTQIWRNERDGKFPKRVRYSAGRVGWVDDEIDQHIAACMAARGGAA